jgi:hypothetical protein
LGDVVAAMRSTERSWARMTIPMLGHTAFQ